MATCMHTHLYYTAYIVITNDNHTSLSAVGSETHENVMSQAWTTSDGVLPRSAPSLI